MKLDLPRLTEMKGGISSIAGVEELVSLMQKQKKCISVNVDIFKQWSTILSIISATENKTYLDHFVQLDGLNYLHEWLMQAQKCTDCGAEEFVITLLTTIERLPNNIEKFISCGIMITVEQLRDQKNITVKNKAQVFLDRWSNAIIGGTEVGKNFQPVHIADSNVLEKDLSSARAIGRSQHKESGERVAGEESVVTESHHLNLSRCSDSSQVKHNTKFITSIQALTSSSSNSTCVDEVGDCNSSSSSLVLDSCQEKFSIVPCPTVELDHARICSFYTAFQMDDNMQDAAVGGDLKVDPLEMEMEIEKMNGYRCTSPQKGTFDLSSSSFLSTSMPLEEGLEHAPQILVYREGELSSLKNVKYQENVISNLLCSKSTIIAKKSVFDFEDEEMDALEVARQVAVEVEREVVGYREHFNHSPDMLFGNATRARSPDFDGIQDNKPGLDFRKFSPSEHSSNYVSSQKDNLQLSDRIIDDQITDEQISESPRMMPTAKEQDLEMEKNQYEFDLNENIYKGEIEHPASPIPTGTVKISTPIVVFASKGIPGLPISSVQFEGESGWSGYSATSAFRPVSPRKTPDGEKGPDLKRKLNFLEIDLNLTEAQNDEITDPASLRKIPVSSAHSSMEVSSRKVEKLKLDLNSLVDEDVAAKPSLNYRPQLQNRDHRLSTASSSCSKQHYMRDFDLNDNPTTLVDTYGSSLHVEMTSKPFPMHKSTKLDDEDSLIKIMSLRMPADRKLCKIQAQKESFLNNGFIDNVIPAKPMVHYPQINPAFGTVLYGPGSIPYMVVSRSFPSATRQPSVLMNVAGAPLGISESFPSVAHMGLCESGRRNVEANFNHLFIHSGKPEENPRTSLQPSSGLGMVLKRKEPDSRVEGHHPLPFNRMPS